MRRSATFLRGKPLQVVLASPYQRAQQTADEVCKALGFSGRRKPWTGPRPSRISKRPCERSICAARRSALVTHQPFVGNLAGWLVNGSHSEPLPMATASLAELEGEAIAGGLMQLASCIMLVRVGRVRLVMRGHSGIPEQQ